jgi:hypothetical protein
MSTHERNLMAIKLHVELDGVTERLILTCQAVVLCEQLPKSSGQILLARAKAARMFLVAGEYWLAKSALADVITVVGGLEEPYRQALLDQTERVSNRIDFATKTPAPPHTEPGPGVRRQPRRSA